MLHDYNEYEIFELMKAYKIKKAKTNNEKKVDKSKKQVTTKQKEEMSK